MPSISVGHQDSSGPANTMEVSAHRLIGTVEVVKEAGWKKGIRFSVAIRKSALRDVAIHWLLVILNA